MTSSIPNLMKKLYVEGIYYTHVSMVNPKGKYQINRELIEKFWELYNDTLVRDGDKFIIGLAEKPQNYIPILCDIDIKKTEEEMENIVLTDNRIYTDKNLTDVVEIYQSVLRNIIEDCTDDHLLCVVLEKDMYTIKKNEMLIYKHGYHLHFPNCFLSKSEHENHLIPRIQIALKELNVFANLGYEDSSVLLDAGYLKAPWLLYGGRKEGDHMKPYNVTKVINSLGKNISIEEAFQYYNIYNVSDQLIDIKNDIRKNLPRILSILPSGRSCCDIKYGLHSPIKENYIKKNKIIKNEEDENNTYKNNDSIVEKLRISKKLLSMLSDHRADDRNEWITIGWILYNIGEGCSEALQLWIEFSNRNEDKFDENECISHWQKMTKKELSIASLHYFAKIDNEEMYKEFQIENGKKHIEEGIEGSHNDIAKLMHVLYGTEYVCASITNKTWYQFKNHHWEEIEGGVFLREKISSEIVKTFGTHGGEVFARSAMAMAESMEEKVYQMRIKQLSKLISNLKNSPYKSNIMNEACEVFFNKNFKEKLDMNPFLIGFRNGIYDLKLNVFRPGRPEDYISKCMPINYYNFNKTDSRVLDVYDYLEKVFPDKSVRNYFLDTSSDVFEGGNKQKTIIFWTGEGDNAKSVTQTIMERILGPYAIKFNTTLVTGKKVQTGSSNPELARAGGGVRWAVLEEPDNDEELNVGMLKSLSGNDSYWARDLFEKGKSTKEITPLFKIIFICLANGTSVSLANGTSVSIENLINNKNQKLLSWDSKTDCLVKTNQNAFFKKGLQECITLTLKDGRKITCTPTHKFLTNDNEWIEAKNIEINNTFLKMGVDNPKCDDIFNDYNFMLEYREYNFNFNNYNDRLKAIAYSRLFGYILTDTSFKNNILSTDNQFDLQTIIDDIELLTDKIPTVSKNNNLFEILAPPELIKSKDSIVLPDFIMDSSCPLFIIREFIASIFGKSGIMPSLIDNCFTNIQLVIDVNNKKVVDIINLYTQLSIILKNNFEIETKINILPYEKDISKKNVHLNIDNHKSKFNFSKNIGIRYCYQKSYVLSSMSSCYRYARPDIKDFLEQTELIKFLDNKAFNNENLPCYKMQIINIENAGLKEVFDINIDEPYSNFIAEGILTHNCNKLIKIKYSDKAFWNRVKVLPFETTFVRPGEPCPEKYEEQLEQKRFPMDPEFNKKIPGLLEPMCWLLLEHRKSIQGKGRIEPEKVKLATNMYRKQNDIYRQFIDECIVEADKHLSLTELYEGFLSWYRLGYPKHSVPIRNDVQEYFTKLWDEPGKGMKWFGYRIKTLDEEIENGDVIILGENDIVNYEKKANKCEAPI